MLKQQQQQQLNESFTIVLLSTYKNAGCNNYESMFVCIINKIIIPYANRISTKGLKIFVRNVKAGFGLVCLVKHSL